MATVRPNPRFSAEYRRPDNHRQWTRDAARLGGTAITAAAPRQTGFLKQSIRTRTYPGTRGPTVRYQTPADYAVYQEVGTGLYGPLRRWITPRTRKALSWIDTRTGQRRFAKRVRGSKPRRYFRKGMEATFGRGKVRYYGAYGRPSER